MFCYLETYVEICVSKNVCKNTWYLKTKNVYLSGCIKHLLKEEKRKIVVLFGVGLSLMTNFYALLGFICIVTNFSICYLQNPNLIVYQRRLVGLMSVFKPTHHGGLKNTQPITGVQPNPTQPTLIRLGRVRLMGWTIFFNYYYYY